MEPFSLQRPRFLLIDSHPVMRRGLAAVLDEAFEDPATTGCGSFSEALDFLAVHVVDLVVTDFRIMGETALSFLANLALHPQSARCLIFSALDEIRFGVPCVRAGAFGFLSKSAPLSSVADAVHSILAGRPYFSETLAKSLANRHGPSSPDCPTARLTARELQFFSLIGESLGVSQIAARLGLSVKTVEAHREHIKHKLHLHTSAQVTAAAVRWIDDTSVSI